MLFHLEIIHSTDMFELDKNTKNEPVLKTFLRHYEGESIIWKFMRGPDDWNISVPHADITEEFCGYMNGRDILRRSSSREKWHG